MRTMRRHITRDLAGTEAHTDRFVHPTHEWSEPKTNDTIIEPRDHSTTAVTWPNIGAHKREILCSSLGFLAGVLFWHLVGFWTFISGVVFNVDAADMVAANTAKNATAATSRPTTARPASDTLNDADRNSFARRISRTIEAAPETPATDRASQRSAATADPAKKPDTVDRYAMLETGSITKVDDNCAALALDRHTGIIRTSTCIGDESLFATNQNSMRGDLATLNKNHENETSTDESWARVNFAPDAQLQISD